MNTNEIITIINALMNELGNVTLGEAKTWAEVKANAEKLKKQAETDADDK